MHPSKVLALTLYGVLSAIAAPIEDWVTTLTQISESALESWAPYTQLTKACDAVPGFEPSLAAGDGNYVQYYFVGYWPTNNAVVVAHQGIDPLKFESLFIDIEIVQTHLDSALFPGVPSNVMVHEGFADEPAKTAQIILAEVQNLGLISQHGATEVFIVGHSLGGALAELDCLYLTLNLPSNIHIKGQTYGTPRVGNPAYASSFDSRINDFVRINNVRDPIPTLPGEFLGFSHVQGEIHIVSDSASDTSDVALRVPRQRRCYG
ncbi:alpha beta-hydrolase [Coniophora puteana RWD-64-598 SS2]|uniref:Alpha beta-hydrolase n=1 Tax=Coniophora puteana (strain RWD-64-598) TaxID=741705 RepID=A0A5M3MGN6_CONPW|nr:alpha beta-hydrolase [Coniophora puteana RWD-64-598 SS2]EIW78156.1 alpha beta-hydrolase [Coniophora puteana RWD-64-598 SS2]